MPSSDTQFKPGNKAGKGRKKGSKNKVSKRVLDAIYKSLADADITIEDLKNKDLAAYWRIAAGQVPKDIDVGVSGGVSVRVVNYEDDKKSS